MKRIVLAVAFLTAPFAFATTATAADVSVAFSEGAEASFAEDYGVREKDYLAAAIARRVGAALPDGYSAAVTVTEAKPSRPTLKQMSDKPGLSFLSFGIGGAAFEVAITAPGGATRTLTYKWFETDILESQFESTWGDAQTAIQRLSHRVGKATAG